MKEKNTIQRQREGIAAARLKGKKLVDYDSKHPKTGKILLPYRKMVILLPLTAGYP
ncbi:hypothetical protein UF75_5295 [Desulfosporosinus sp. I2]|uniref:hypothetical protein n=1 Tax=Desulfosporosinus sp. I2 TaxID=1617025 RepID=UPI00061E1DF8|nr:hypothetical protein UF75_5295 [Desulfosporosinus sp. I2]